MKRNLNLKITKRDKKLLAGTGCILLAYVLIWLILIPSLLKSEELKSNAALVTAQREESRMQEKNLESARVLAETAETQLEAMKGVFYDRMTSAELGKLMTDAALAHELHISNLTIEMPEKGSYASLSDYSGAEEETVCEGIYKATVYMTLNGREKKLQDFMDAICAEAPRQQLAGFDWQQSSEGSFAGLTLRTDVYMCEDIAGYVENHLVSVESAGSAEDILNADGAGSAEDILNADGAAGQ